ncbi:hypothetical protein [Nocardia sp. XZ_19_369]|uniref:hypothetical protein n=1 Tax=Nocardia sp. XZ_19_369 TaxID=2769487 RepID=UPI00188FEDDA|nr:hypothetical protein [Nocardia sp. XZ_19_369]
MKDRPVLVAALIGGFIGAMLSSPFAVYFGFGPPVLATVIVGVGILLAGAVVFGSLCAALVLAVKADRRNGGYRCRGASQA